MPYTQRARSAPHAVVTGAAGFIGSHLIDALCAQGYHVTGIDALLDRPYDRSIKRATAARLAVHERFRFVAADLCVHPLERLVASADLVVHAGALAGLGATNADPAAAWAHNAYATARLVDAAQMSGVRRLVHVSTSSVYGARAEGGEHQTQRPVSVYGRSKQAAERLVLRAARTGRLDAVVVRYFSIYGPRQRPDMAYHRFITALLDERVVTVHGDGRQRRSITYVADAVAGTLAAAQHGRCGEAYNLGGGVSIDVLEAVELVAATMNTRPRLQFAPGPPGDQWITAADCTKAAAELGWVPQVEPPEGIARQVAWHTADPVDGAILALAAES